MDSLKGSLGGLMTGSGRKDSVVEAMAKSAARTVGSTVGREIVRGVLGSLLGGEPPQVAAGGVRATRTSLARHATGGFGYFHLRWIHSQFAGLPRISFSSART